MNKSESAFSDSQLLSVCLSSLSLQTFGWQRTSTGASRWVVTAGVTLVSAVKFVNRVRLGGKQGSDKTAEVLDGAKKCSLA